MNWDHLRQSSLQPGGFRSLRTSAWPFLLNVSRLDLAHRGTIPEPHPDERQVALDTERSFVLYPVEEPETKQQLKSKLHDTIVSVLRDRRKLSYFQGYHDIVSVLLLTLPAEQVAPAVEKMSLHRLRDAMGPGLEPLVGQLRILKRLLRLVDPDVALILERASPLPYFALSNLLTLFAHDMPTLPLIQHVFDFLLCRPPVASLYLAAALVKCRRPEIMAINEEQDEGMLHALLSSLPPMDDSVEKSSPEERGSCETAVADVPSSDTPDAFPISPETLPRPQTPARHEAADSASDISLERAEALETDVASTSGTLTSPVKFSAVAPLQLCDVLLEAARLLDAFPPSDPRLAVNRIMGPQSVLFTWAEGAAGSDPKEEDGFDDDDAEAMVGKPDLVVRGDFVDEDELRQEQRRIPARNKPRRCGSGPWLKTSRPSTTTMLAGVVLAVSIGIAMYEVSKRVQGRKEL